MNSFTNVWVIAPPRAELEWNFIFEWNGRVRSFRYVQCKAWSEYITQLRRYIYIYITEKELFLLNLHAKFSDGWAREEPNKLFCWCIFSCLRNYIFISSATLGTFNKINRNKIFDFMLGAWPPTNSFKWTSALRETYHSLVCLQK